MYYYTTYDTTTGEIMQAGMCSNACDVLNGTPSGHSVVEGLFQPDKLNFKVQVVQGAPQIVRKTTGPLIHKTRKSSPKRISETEMNSLESRITALEAKVNG